MSTKYLLTLFALLFSSTCTAQITVLGFESNGTAANMYFMDSDELSIVRKSIALTDPTNTYTIGRTMGAAYHYVDNQVYILAATGSTSAKSSRVIFTVDTISGEVTEVVDPQDDLWQSMAILEDGTILLSAGAQTGLGRGIYSIDRSTGAATKVADVPAGNPNSIAFVADNDLVYFTHSNQNITTDSTLLALDPADWSVTDVELTNTAVEFVGGGMTYLGNDSVLVSNLAGDLIIYPVGGGAANTSPSFSSSTGKIKAMAGIYHPDGIVGRAAAVESFEVSVFPNPAQDILRVGVGTDNTLEALAVRDLSGRTLLVAQVSGRSEVLDLSRLSAGLYVLELQTSKGLHSQRVVVR